jgi:hypothetical protein
MADGDNECIAFFDAGADITATAEAAVSGKRFVVVSDPQPGPVLMGLSTTSEGSNIVVSHAAAGGPALGVSSYDAGVGKKLYVLRGKKVVPVKTGAAVSAGAEVQSDATGQAIPLAAGKALGMAVDDAASGADCPIALY